MGTDARSRSAGGGRAVHAFAEGASLGRRLARALGVPFRAIGSHRFPDGESLVRVRAAPGESAIVVRSLDDPDAKIVELLLAADALRRSGARRVVLVAPYLAYMRQDKVFRSGEPVSQRVVARVLGGAFDRVLTVEAHLHRTRKLADVFPCAARSLPAAPVLADHLGRAGRGTMLVGPDEESAAWVRRLARLAGLPYAVARKHRLGDRRVRIELPAIPAPGGRRVLLVDDVASSGATLAATARALRRRGVPRVDALVVHPVFAPGALARLSRAGVARVVSCDTIPHETNRISVVPLLAPVLAGGARARPGRARREGGG